MLGRTAGGSEHWMFRIRLERQTYINLDGVTFREPTHVPLGKEPVRKKREEHKLG